MAGAKNAVETCLAVCPEEHVALIADQASAAVAASLAAALNERKAAFTELLLEDLGPRPMSSAPKPVLEALETADVGILCMNPQPGELGARMAIVRVVERRRIRYAHMVGVTPQIMQQGMRADYKKVDQLSDRLRERMLRAETLTVKTEAGTSFAAHFDRGLDWVKTSGLISPRYWSNLPAAKRPRDGTSPVCSSWTTADLPMPAAPETSTSSGIPLVTTRSKAASSVSISRARP